MIVHPCSKIISFSYVCCFILATDTFQVINNQFTLAINVAFDIPDYVVRCWKGAALLHVILAETSKKLGYPVFKSSTIENDTDGQLLPSTHKSTQVKVLNLSRRELSKSQISLLCKGPKFCPTTSGNFMQMKADTKEFTRKLKLQERFADCDFEDESLVSIDLILMSSVMNQNWQKLLRILKGQTQLP